MTFSPPRRLAAVAGVLGAVCAVVAGLVLWRLPDLEALPALPAELPGDVARQFIPGELGREDSPPPGFGVVSGGPDAAAPQTLNTHCSTPNAEAQNPSGGRGFVTRALGGVDRANDGAWARFNRLTPRLHFSHNLGSVFSLELFATHPDFFPQEAGMRIHPPAGSGWWNPDLGREDVAAYAADMAREYFSSKPVAIDFALGVNDGLIFGESSETLALTIPLRWFRERPDYTNLVFTFMNRAAADLAQTHPDKYLGALAYYWAENAPDFPVHPQVIPFLTADRSQGFDRAFQAEEQALQARWIARMSEGRDQRAENGRQMTAGDNPWRIGLYDYLYGHGFLIPRIHTGLIVENLRTARRLGFTDYFAEMTPNWGLDGPQPWLVAQLLQDPEQSERRLMAEYYRRYFKESAFPMRRFFKRCEEQWINQPGSSYWLKHFRNESQAVVFPSSVCHELRGILNEAQQRANSNLVRSRVKQVSDAFGVTERFVTMQEARERTIRLALIADSDPKENLSALQRYRLARKVFVAYTKKLQTDQPMLIAPFAMDDYLRHDPSANTLVSIMRRKEGGVWDRKSIVELGIDNYLVTLVTSIAAVQHDGRELVINGSLTGLQKPERRIAGLTYSVAMPEPWQSRVEPVQFHQAELSDGAPHVLKISGTKDTSVFQWCALDDATFALGQVMMRGRVSCSGVAMLTLGWLDAQHRHLGTTVIRLPEGEWSDWHALRQATAAPVGAAWVGIGVRIQHQLKDDWVEVKNFSLKVSK
jgi:hypothetical protein